MGTLFLSALAKIVFALVLLLSFAPVLVWAERRQSAMMQDRVGPHRAGIPMPRALLDIVPLLAMGATAVGVLSLLGAAGSLIAMIANHGAMEVPGVGIGVQTLFFPLLLVGGVHLLLGKLLPSMFFGGQLTAWGLIHPLADVVKMIFKEDLVPPKADKFLFNIAPIIALIPSVATFAVIPFGDVLFTDQLFTQLPATVNRAAGDGLQIASVNVGILYMFAIAGTGIVGAAIAGYSSDNKYALLGGIRAASQMVSYEVTLGLSLVGCFMVYGTLLLEEMVRWQSEHVWGIFVQPLAFILFLTAQLAETKRVPFDAPEGESEIVAGYFLEYSGFKWGMFFMGEFIEVATGAALVATLFLGGWDVPFLHHDGWHSAGLAIFGTQILPAWTLDLSTFMDGRFAILSEILNAHLTVVLVQVGAFIFKMALLCWLSLMIRWTLPRFRYDQIMQLCWKILLPLSLANILLTGLAILAFG